MEVILREDIEKLGGRGQIVKVADGYARNFLLPRRLAVPATDANRKIVEQERQAHLRREAKEKASAEELGRMLATVTLVMAQKAGEQDQLFGSVTPKDIAEALEKQNYHVDRRKILLEEPIKQLGEFKVPIRLHREVTVEITVQVVKEEEEQQ
jgi:large subunit ribosomal protein L9